MGWFSKLATGACLAYTAFLFRNVIRLGDLSPADSQEIRIPHAVRNDTHYRLSVFLSTSPKDLGSKAELVVACDATFGQTPQPVWRATSRKALGWGDPNPAFNEIQNCTVRRDSDMIPLKGSRRDIKFEIPSRLIEAKELYLHATATLREGDSKGTRHVFPPAVSRFTALMPIEKLATPVRFLLHDPSGDEKKKQLQGLVKYWTPHLHQAKSADLTIAALKKEKFVAYPTEVTVGPVVHADPLPVSQIRRRGLNRYLFRSNEGSLQWLLPLSVNTLTAPRDEFLPLKERELVAATTEDLSIVLSPPRVTLRFRPISLRGLLVQQALVGNLQRMEDKFGMGEYDIDSLKMMMGGGNPFLVTCTVVISVLHILFSILALASDVNFWRREENVRGHGVSRSSIELEALLESLIVLNLWWEGQSMFVLVFPIAHLGMLGWKRSKLTGCKSEQLKELEAYERQWMIRLSVPMVTACIGVCVWLLATRPQSGWAGWVIKSLAMCAYGAGFASMTPQVFRNYKLQSVENLPWATLVYQALNAFVDDFFALIIRMPQMHRISVFRDDVIFLVYSFQRWKYRKIKTKID